VTAPGGRSPARAVVDRLLRGRGVENRRALSKGPPSRLTGLSERASLFIGHLLVRDRPDDRYIYSYPRSGSTWLRSILAPLMDPTVDGADPDLRRALIPGVSIRGSRVINEAASPRLIKSHGRFMGRVPRAVYLVRDGRDVLVSLYHYRVTRPGHGDRIDFRDFCKMYFRGDLGQLWHRNVLGWLERGRSEMGDALKIVRFEDLRADVPGKVADICRFLRIEAEPASIARAIELASLDRMREVERARQGTLDANRTFYRGGKVGQWQDMLTGELAERFMKGARSALIAAGYPA